MSTADFRRQLIEDILRYCDDQHAGAEDESSSPAGSKSAKKARRKKHAHQLLKLEKGLGKWNGAQFVTPKQPYQKYRCCYGGCKRLVRTYCACDRGFIVCAECYAKHSSDWLISHIFWGDFRPTLLVLYGLYNHNIWLSALTTEYFYVQCSYDKLVVRLGTLEQ